MKNTTIVWSVLGLIVVAGLIYYATQSNLIGSDVTNPTATTTITVKPSTPVVKTPQAQEAGAPIVVTSPNLTTSETAVSVSGTVIPHGFFTNYWFEYGLTTSLGSKTTVQNIGSGYVPITSPGFITGLSKNTIYYVRLVAENQYGKVAGVQYSFKTGPGNPNPVGSLPTIKTLAGNTITRTSATLNGEVTPNQSTTQYWFEYGKTENFGRISTFQNVSNTSSKTAVYFVVSDLDPATNYYFRLNAQNQWGTVTGEVLSFKTSGPADTSKPLADTVSATNVKDTSVTLRGTVNPNGIVTTYWFDYSTDSLLGSILLKSTEHKSAGSGTVNASFTTDVPNLVSKTNYFYRIVAQNSLGTTYGDRVSFKTK